MPERLVALGSRFTIALANQVISDLFSRHSFVMFLVARFLPEVFTCNDGEAHLYSFGSRCSFEPHRSIAIDLRSVFVKMLSCHGSGANQSRRACTRQRSERSTALGNHFVGAEVVDSKDDVFQRDSEDRAQGKLDSRS